MRASIRKVRPAASAAGFFGVLPEMLALQREVDRDQDEKAIEAEKAAQARKCRQAAQATYDRKREELRAKIMAAMRKLGPATAHQLIPRVGCDISCLRKHLQAMEADGLVEHSGNRRQYIWRAL